MRKHSVAMSRLQRLARLRFTAPIGRPDTAPTLWASAPLPLKTSHGRCSSSGSLAVLCSLPRNGWIDNLHIILDLWQSILEYYITILFFVTCSQLDPVHSHPSGHVSHAHTHTHIHSSLDDMCMSVVLALRVHGAAESCSCLFLEMFWA